MTAEGRKTVEGWAKIIAVCLTIIGAASLNLFRMESIEWKLDQVIQSNWTQRHMEEWHYTAEKWIGQSLPNPREIVRQQQLRKERAMRQQPQPDDKPNGQ